VLVKLPENLDIITRNALALNDAVPDPYKSYLFCLEEKLSFRTRRFKHIMNNLIQKLHEFVKETKWVINTHCTPETFAHSP
jgi:hypothetical protein